MIEKRTEKGQENRIKNIASLKNSREKIMRLQQLQTQTGWSAFKELMQEGIKAQKDRRDAFWYREFDSSYSEEQEKVYNMAGAMYQTAVERIINLVENSESEVTRLNIQIHDIQKEIKEAELELA